MGQIGSALSSGLGGQQYPFFQSAGGVTPFQADAAAYTGAEDTVKQASEFANAGTGISTMATQGAGVGPQNLQAQELMNMSNADMSAQMQAQNIANQTNNQNISQGKSQISGLANLAGKL